MNIRDKNILSSTIVSFILIYDYTYYMTCMMNCWSYYFVLLFVSVSGYKLIYFNVRGKYNVSCWDAPWSWLGVSLASYWYFFFFSTMAAVTSVSAKIVLIRFVDSPGRLEEENVIDIACFFFWSAQILVMWPFPLQSNHYISRHTRVHTHTPSHNGFPQNALLHTHTHSCDLQWKKNRARELQVTE